jgi:2-methylisocitrate lyase-like PEP mutase family enzyme
MRKTTRLKALIQRPEILLCPGVYDAYLARSVEQAGFEAVYMTGAGVSHSRLGVPDLGLVSFAEMLDQAGRIADSVDIPLIADADTGYGNAINVMRTIRAYERAGVAGCHIEDQEMPKRCGHFDEKRVVPVSEMLGKLAAALDARVDPDFIIIARTDARGVLGLDEALERAQAYAGAGADVIFVESRRWASRWSFIRAPSAASSASSCSRSSASSGKKELRSPSSKACSTSNPRMPSSAYRRCLHAQSAISPDG